VQLIKKKASEHEGFAKQNWNGTTSHQLAKTIKILKKN